MSYNPRFSGVTDITLNYRELNNTGITIPKAAPVRIDVDGNMARISVSVEDEALSIAGLVENDVTVGVGGSIINTGRIKDVTTAAGFGDTIYLSATGGITEIKPTIGSNGFIAGDFVVKLGIVSKNQADPLKKDLFINIVVVGQL